MTVTRHLPFFLQFLFIRSVQNIVHRHVVKIRQFNENLRGNIQFPALVIAIYALTARQDLAHFLLRQISVFPQVSDPFIQHNFHHQNSLCNNYKLMKIRY